LTFAWQPNAGKRENTAELERTLEPDSILRDGK